MAPLDEAEIREILRSYKHRAISAESAMAQLGLSDREALAKLMTQYGLVPGITEDSIARLQKTIENRARDRSNN